MKGFPAPWGPNQHPLAQRICWLLLCFCRGLEPVPGSLVPRWDRQQARHFYKWLRARCCCFLMKGGSQLASGPDPKGESSSGSFQPPPASRDGLICSMASSEEPSGTLSREASGRKSSPLWPSHFCQGAELAPPGLSKRHLPVHMGQLSPNQCLCLLLQTGLLLSPGLLPAITPTGILRSVGPFGSLSASPLSSCVSPPPSGPSGKGRC